MRFANPTLPEFSDDLPIAPAVVALLGHHGKPKTLNSYTTRRDSASQIAQQISDRHFNGFAYRDLIWVTELQVAD